MRIKLDENLPDRLVPVLTALGHDVDTVHGEQLTGRTDPDVWSAAQSTQRFLVTQDSIFRTCAGTRLERTRAFCSFAYRDQVGTHYLTA